jgi:hypothetical protein
MRSNTIFKWNPTHLGSAHENFESLFAGFGAFSSCAFPLEITVDTYGHLIPGADISWMDRVETSSQTNANPAQTEGNLPNQTSAEEPQATVPVELIGGGGRTRTYDLRIMRPSL